MGHDPTGRVFDALADPNRRYVVKALAQRPTATATELALELPVTRQAVSKHLAALSEAGLVESHREGRETRYELRPAALGDAMAWMAEVEASWDTRLDRLRAHLAAGRSDTSSSRRRKPR
jgi:DNA-binding transcriptional ArsR family regulator